MTHFFCVCGLILGMQFFSLSVGAQEGSEKELDNPDQSIVRKTLKITLRSNPVIPGDFIVENAWLDLEGNVIESPKDDHPTITSSQEEKSYTQFFKECLLAIFCIRSSS